MSYYKKPLIFLFAALILGSYPQNYSFAGNRFQSSYYCFDAVKTCNSSGIREVDGFKVHRDCWEWGYTKKCNYPSKNNCSSYAHCYAIGLTKCLLYDTLGYCVNQEKEFSCKRWIPDQIESQKTRVDLVEKDGQEGLVCKGIPCIDGNCIDKSYQTNGEMMDSISKLYAVSKMKDGGNPNIKLFAGYNAHCSKKVTSYSNCCGTGKGWGQNFGAKCTKDEQNLINTRRKNLCVYVGKENKGVMKTVVKHHFCCWGNMLDKVIQVQGRKQLGMNFGSGGSTNCRGLTLDEIQKLNFDEMDFSEFIEDFKVKFFGKYKEPNVGDMELRVKGSIPDIRKYDDNPNNQANNMTGWSGHIKDDSWEAQEEKRLEAERKKQEADKIEYEKNQRKLLKEKELAVAKNNLTKLKNEFEIFRKPFCYAPNHYNLPQGELGKEFRRKEAAWRDADGIVYKMEYDLKNGNY